MKIIRNSIFALAMSGVAAVSMAAPAMAQDYGPHYNVWQRGWDQNHVDRHHVMLGEVSSFKPYRLWIRRRNGSIRQIDLKNGTVIRPLGATPRPGQHVAVVGYYSGGTFIARRIVLR